jgi:hypothetical protein
MVRGHLTNQKSQLMKLFLMKTENFQKASCQSFFVDLPGLRNYSYRYAVVASATRQGVFCLTIALRIIKSLCIQAIRATFLSLPRSIKEL